MKRVNPSAEQLEDQLINRDQIKEEHNNSKPFYQIWMDKLLNRVQTQNRKIYFNGVVHPQNHQNNIVKNTKYNIITFLPLVLFNQFKFFFNMFFLVTALTQLIEVLKVGLFLTFIGPLILVLTLTMGKQAYDDFRTYRRDKEANSKQYSIITKTGERRAKSEDLKVGDIVKINGLERVPADMLLLYSSDEQGTLFIKTDQLDGETDWKLRKALKYTQNMFKIKNEQTILNNASVRCDVKGPHQNIYEFDGLFIYEDGKEKLSLQNTMWASTVVTNGLAIGIVLYTGKQTRVALGASTPRTKVGILDLEVNLLSKILFGIMVGLTITLVLMQGMEIKYAPIQFMRILILLSSIIPISMRVNLDFAKLFYASQINNDSSIPQTITRSSNTPEQLGRVKYILSDKTGTLTQNQMIFKRISIQQSIKFTDEHLEQLQIIMADESNNLGRKEKSVQQIIIALALCHNVTPVFDEQNHKDFQASSPDEITFVKIAESLGVTLEERTQSYIKIGMPSLKKITYEILYTFPFNSDTKRMGIILKNSQTDQIQFYLKGADAIMKSFIQSKQKKAFIQEECKDLSMIGLRTLVISKKKLTLDQYQNWSQKYEEHNQKLEVDKKQIEKLMNQLENGVEFLGVTGIQDKLQQDLKSAIESLRGADLKIWMITGDKIQTAECIGISCGLQRTTQENIKIEEVDKIPNWKAKWEIVKNSLKKVLIIDGKTLTMVLDNSELKQQFFQTAMKMPAVICSRCSPQQKRVLTQGVKQFRGKKEAVLGIGDGGNDVGMIQAADVGVGIVGKQGMQAALAAQFSITKFKHIKTLLLWHGRNSYKRSSLLANFIIHRGFIVSIIQMVFSMIFFYVSIPVFNSYLNLGYATFFTFWPVFSMILDTDINKQTAQKYPRLYSSLQLSNQLSWFTFLTWIWMATFQGSIIMILTMIIFQDSSYIITETICFTVLILTQYLMTLSQLHRIHILTLIFVGGSILCYAACILFLRNLVHVSTLTLQDFVLILIITICSWAPIFIGQKIRKWIAPSDHQIVMKNVKRNKIAVNLIRGSRMYEQCDIQPNKIDP